MLVAAQSCSSMTFHEVSHIQACLVLVVPGSAQQAVLMLLPESTAGLGCA